MAENSAVDSDASTEQYGVGEEKEELTFLVPCTDSSLCFVWLVCCSPTVAVSYSKARQIGKPRKGGKPNGVSRRGKQYCMQN